MTDAEWNELCDWAEKLNSDRIRVDRDITVEAFEENTIYVLSIDDYFGYKIGLTIEQDGMIYSSGWTCIAESCTSQQIKLIIKILLNQNVKIKS